MKIEIKNHLQDEKGEGGDIAGVIHGGDQLLQLHGRGEIPKIIDPRFRLGINEKHSLALAIDLDPSILITP